MKTLRWFLLSSFIPSFLIACLFFSLIIELADLFAHLVRYLQMQSPLKTIMHIQLLYLPKCLSYSIPIAMIFSSSLTMGNMYSNNELIAIFSSGVSLFRFTSSILAFALIVSIGSFFFQEMVVIDTLKAKGDLGKTVLGFGEGNSTPNVVLFDKGTKVVYKAALYNDATKVLNDVLVVRRTSSGIVDLIIKAGAANWDPVLNRWNFKDVSHYDIENVQDIGKEDLSMIMTSAEQFSDPLYDLAPNSFKQVTQNIEELKIGSAGPWIQSLKESGLPYKAALESYYERFSFACTPLLVAFISCAIGSRFRKNILLMSLLVSLMLAVIYYVIQMVSGLMANLQIIPPIIGAWVGVVIFLVVGTYLFRQARS